ncbi:MAG: vitamin K epoxide reductase family protein [Microbacteriaceae bacterium]|nr:vitamin K epoxide reductase family protein [Microbacteriaceae bacterium]
MPATRDETGPGARDALRGALAHDADGAEHGTADELDEYDEYNEHDEHDRIPALLRARPIGWVLVVGGAIGLLASFMLTLEYLHKLQDPSGELICDINPFITCGPAMLSDAGSVLGFPNIILGLVAFTVTITTGVVVLVGARLPVWYWAVFQVGLVGAAALITYLQWFSAFDLGKLCLWCMIIWTGTIPLVALVTISSLATGRLGAGAVRAGRALASWAWVVVVLWYLAVIAIILVGMWDSLMLAV